MSDVKQIIRALTAEILHAATPRQVLDEGDFAEGSAGAAIEARLTDLVDAIVKLAKS